MTDMHLRRVFTLDPDYFPVDRMQEIVHYLHDHQQRFSKSLPWAS
jgi:alpha-glucosidase